MQELLLLLGLVFSLHFLNAYSWHLLTKVMGFNITFGENIRIWMFPNIARYIPGKIWHYVGRVYLLSRQGVSKSQGTLAVLLDAIFTLSVGSLVVLLAVFVFNFPLARGIEWILSGIILLPIVIATIFSNQKLLNIVVRFLQKVTKRAFSLRVYKFSFGWLIILTFVYFLNFLFAGISLFLIARGLFELQFELLPVFVGVYSAAWILAYMSFFTPGGLGVQEVSIAGMLSLFMPFSIASLIAILFRIALLFSELASLSLVACHRALRQDPLLPILHTRR